MSKSTSFWSSVGAYLGEVLGITAYDGAREPRQGDLAKSDVVGVESTYTTCGWTIDRVQCALEALDRGEMAEPYALYLAMTRHPLIKHGLKLRRDTLSQVRWYHDKPEGLDDAFFEQWVARWPQTWQKSEQLLANGYKIPLGLCPVNVVWSRSRDGRWLQPTAHTKEPGSVEWYETQRIYKFYHLTGALDEYGNKLPEPPLSKTGALDMWPLNGQRWLMLQEEPLRPHLFGAFRSLAVAWFLSAESSRWHSAHNRKHALDWIGVKMPHTERESAETRALLDACVALENGGVIPLPQHETPAPSWGLEVFAAKTDASKSMVSLREAADNYITLVLLGVLETTGGGSASNGKASTQKVVSLRMTKGDAAGIIELHDELARTACSVNGRDPANAPKLVCIVDDPEEQALLAEKQERAAKAGLTVAQQLEKLEDVNAKRLIAKLPPIEYDPDHLYAQAGVQLTPGVDGLQTAPR